MIKTILQRLFFALFTLIFVSGLVFSVVELLPGNVCTAYLQRAAQGVRLQQCIQQQGLDKPALARYQQWVGGIAEGDFGTSLKRRKPISELVQERFRNTALLSGFAAAIGIPLALLFGFWAGIRRDKPADLVISSVAMLAMTIPEFVSAALLIFVFAVWLNWFPAITTVPPNAPIADLLPNLVLPVLVLAFVMTAHILRMTRAAVIEVMASDFIQMAKLKGVPAGRIFWRHLAPSALIPAINVVALTIAWLLGGVVVIEQVFNYPGMGTLMLQAIYDRDLPLVQAIALIFAIIYIVVNLLADLLILLLDPRLRHAKTAL
ncbi:ABC transporter permease [Testudinibacter aquarius]|uniref:ABC transporter permease n=1 Tax=Testudinibacter aquarius TaxID=1524974 RepID=A0A4V6P3U0_9PAST|nr:ABC transporter permease [Testudinibacter aquarius]TNG92431.1 ABC transporter permease [Pasteurellaceae bacterium USgator41]TNG93113.1 ABC transporter permease [Pasteurellaceae bacterium UScroc12]TNG95887.1 ABC transporter permease [Pasteurellaceae bacterium UScroc31]TNG98873.1 ABC transporter permease [Pasteurellaceae bacterium USgator11]KAE9526437.1 ABC transporter permease [Testudinibacter aquarius]